MAVKSLSSRNQVQRVNVVLGEFVRATVVSRVLCKKSCQGKPFRSLFLGSVNFAVSSAVCIVFLCSPSSFRIKIHPIHDYS